MQAVESGDLQAVEKVLDGLPEGDDDAKEALLVKALIAASRKGHQGTINLLLDHGAPIDRKDQYGYTVLHWASEEGQKDCVMVLLGNGSSVNVEDSSGNTALHYAAIEGHSLVGNRACDHYSLSSVVSLCLYDTSHASSSPTSMVNMPSHFSPPLPLTLDSKGPNRSRCHHRQGGRKAADGIDVCCWE